MGDVIVAGGLLEGVSGLAGVAGLILHVAIQFLDDELTDRQCYLKGRDREGAWFDRLEDGLPAEHGDDSPWDAPLQGWT